MENHDMKMEGGKTCGCKHHGVFAWLIILLGLDFLLAAIGVLTPGFVAVTWPILLIIAGCTKLCKCCGKM
jgi:UPF0716 family protein affecting phage T7 exclusion